jgi:hypothetical protein
VKIDVAIAEAAEAEVDLARELRRLSQRHAVEADVHHTAVALAAGCVKHVVALRSAAGRSGASVPDDDSAESPGVMEAIREGAAGLFRRSDATGLVLLDDLRQAYLTAQRAEVDWVMLVQGAKAARDRDLITVATEGEDHARRCGSWLRTRIKESSAQVLACG